jgi:hypothetical protein
MTLADKVTSDHDRNVNFAKFKTFMWIKEPVTDQAFMKDRIMKAVTQQLCDRGFSLVQQGGDLAVGANLSTQEQHVWETFSTGGGGWGWGWGWDGGSTWATTTERTYQVGTLTVDLFDSQTKKLAWQGVGTDEMSRHPEKRTKEIDKQILKMFREFPPVHIAIPQS